MHQLNQYSALTCSIHRLDANQGEEAKDHTVIAATSVWEAMAQAAKALEQNLAHMSVEPQYKVRAPYNSRYCHICDSHTSRCGKTDPVHVCTCSYSHIAARRRYKMLTTLALHLVWI
jgi:hypothetical protein